MKLVTVDAMRAIEKEAVLLGLSYEELMQNAGSNLGKWIEAHLHEHQSKKVVGLVGPGNNGGDTLIALEYLARHGWKVSAYLTGEKAVSNVLTDRVMEAGGGVVKHPQDPDGQWLTNNLKDGDLLLDGVLGTGIHLPLREDLSQILGWVKAKAAALKNLIVVAVDCPSGVDCDNGEAAPETIRANFTVCMAAAKTGLLRFPAFSFVGEIIVVDIGLPVNMPALTQITQFVVDQDMAREILPVRAADAHKGTFGTLLAAAGSINYTGAALLAGKAAYRIGAGLVTMAVPSPLYSVLAGQLPECTWLLLPHELGVISESAADLFRKNIGKATAVLLGPGWGMETTTLKFLKQIVEGNPSQSRKAIGFAPVNMIRVTAADYPLPPLVVDADGLKLLAQIPNWFDLLPKPAVLTPHPGEMSILCGLSKEEIQADRQNIAVEFAQKWGHVVVLKGALTVVASPEGMTAIIPVATAALARAGTGDVLAGIIAGLRAQGVMAFPAAEAGAWIHAQAGLLAAKKVGNTASILAGDVLEAISGVLTQMQAG